MYRPIAISAAAGIAALCCHAALADNQEHSDKSFTWEPGLSPQGPVLVTVNLGTQRAAVYRNGVRIGTCQISSGRPGHRTPTGVFHILNKDKHHHSSSYHNAPMPFSERLTWGGVALHAGSLPGYPSSHGCVHLPYDFAAKLFGITENGTTVIISNPAKGSAKEAEPTSIPDGSLDLRADDSATETAAAFTWEPDKSTTGPLSLLYSHADKKLHVLRGGLEIGLCPVTANSLQELGGGTFALICKSWTPDPAGGPPKSTWTAVGDIPGQKQILHSAWLSVPSAFRKNLIPLIAPGTNLVVTEESVTTENLGQPGFSVLDSSPEAPVKKKKAAGS